MIHAAEAGLFDVVIVHKLDRFSRSIQDVVHYLKHLGDQQVSLVSVSENFDFTTPAGKLMLGMLAVLAEWYLDNLSQETSKGKRERARKGSWNGTLPFGYTTKRRLRQMLIDLGEDFAGGKLAQDDYSHLAGLIEDTLEQTDGRFGDTDAQICPINGPGVVLAFEQYSLGVYSDIDIANLLTASGYRTTGSFGSNPFGKDTITHLLQNCFYIGETSYQGKKKGAQKEAIPGRHEALISQDVFDKCQEVRGKRADAWGRGAANQIATYPLASLLICLTCGSKWRGWGLRGDRRYRDPAKDRGIPCANKPKSVAADQIEAQAAAILMALEIPDDWRERVLERLTKENPAYASLKQQQSSIQSRLERLKQLFIMGDVAEVDYKQMRDEMQAQINAIPLPTQGRIIDLERAVELLSNIKDVWAGATLEEREIWFKLMFNKIYIANGAIKAVEPTLVLSALLDTLSGDDGVRYLVCTKSIYFPRAKHGGRVVISLHHSIIVLSNQRAGRLPLVVFSAPIFTFTSASNASNWSGVRTIIRRKHKNIS
jgi:site-specific DNA recombinase